MKDIILNNKTFFHAFVFAVAVVISTNVTPLIKSGENEINILYKICVVMSNISLITILVSFGSGFYNGVLLKKKQEQEEKQEQLEKENLIYTDEYTTHLKLIGYNCCKIDQLDFITHILNISCGLLLLVSIILFTIGVTLL